MSQLYNIYCDESCHLENDKQPIMAFGALWCPSLKSKQLALKIREIKTARNARGELKWTKTSISHLMFYTELVDWFFGEQDIHFRSLVVKDKSRLNHEAYNKGSHETFYYKMYYSLLNRILDPTNRYNIYLDFKDTQSYMKIIKLCEVLCNNVHDFTHEMIGNVQSIHSKEFELMQMADFLLGAVTYKNRNLSSNPAKKAVVDRIERKLCSSLAQSTSLREEKFNLFVFAPR